MAGIYIHIPFCRQACHYCDFHFSTSLALKEKMVGAILDELVLRKNYLQDEIIETIYFGGGTPSLLTSQQIESLIHRIRLNYLVCDDPEITIEANPDDLSIKKLKSLYSLGVNRLSIGLQSFHQPHLTFLNRIHSSAESTQCVVDAQDCGFENISIDLIYGINASNHAVWHKDVAKAIHLKVPHISAYCLTIENGTVFGNWLKKGKLTLVEDDFASEQFEFMINAFEAAGYEQYEVSNFALPNRYSKHNSSYWKQTPYLGVGPGAHSYDGTNRQFNISNNPKYIKSIENKEVPFTLDKLTKNDLINERILISLRTKWGLNLFDLNHDFDVDLMITKEDYMHQLISNQLALIDNSVLTLTSKGKLLADHIASELFID